ncbi:MAG TPA: hypothetical protein VH619_12305 [Verrucomicrobiae bacterium]|jgi:uncharacterized protein YyaL (SSP411 family)|nr:hypothetical protein [Verrucomicrobiae bacterium]
MKKIIILVTGIVIVALAGFVVVQQQTIQELRRENAGLTQQADQVAPLQEKLDQETQAAANSATTLSQDQVHDLARLRNEVARLRQASNELARARQQISTLNQRVSTEAEARQEAAANTQATVQAQVHQIQNQNACINNLRLIDSAKQQWALETRKLNTDIPQVSDLQPYLGRGPNGEMPVCPDGGVYTFGAVGEKPTCSNPNHVLP